MRDLLPAVTGRAQRSGKPHTKPQAPADARRGGPRGARVTRANRVLTGATVPAVHAAGTFLQSAGT
jgi:hypothetical protein